jgi:hypothetical protein
MVFTFQVVCRSCHGFYTYLETTFFHYFFFVLYMKQKIFLSHSIWALLISCFFSAALHGQSRAINIQGTLKNAQGNAVEDGVHSVTFTLYAEEFTTTPLWQETADVTVKGGIYGYNLGSTNMLNPEFFASPVYLSLTLNGFELKPRTKFSYAPYALGVNKANYVSCSGALGDIKYSVLNPTQFKTVNGDCWVPMNGVSLSSASALRMLTGMTTLPDASGLFIQGQEFSGGQDNEPGRTSSSPIATYQADAMLAHKHLLTGQGDHRHNFVAYSYSGGTSTSPLEGKIGPTNDWYSNTLGDRVLAAGAHSHAIEYAGVAENRSKNINLWIYIRTN